jgi:hypothetical protein
MLALGPIQHSTRPPPLLPQLPSDADSPSSELALSTHGRPRWYQTRSRSR